MEQFIQEIQQLKKYITHSIEFEVLWIQLDGIEVGHYINEISCHTSPHWFLLRGDPNSTYPVNHRWHKPEQGFTEYSVKPKDISHLKPKPRAFSWLCSVAFVMFTSDGEDWNTHRPKEWGEFLFADKIWL